jgi:ADP-heptose:LPS heptosyltransferase
MHIAAAVGTRVVALFGKTPVDVWHPFGKGHVVLKKGNHHNLISVTDVFEAVRRLCLPEVTVQTKTTP